MNSFTIKDLENLSGIKAHTIRIWEQRYHFLKPKRTDTNIRKYSNEELKTILNIALLNKYGFKISHIDKMNQEEINEKILSLGDSRAIQERLINSLVQEMAELDMEKFEKILNAQIAAKGVERTVMQVIFPFLEKIGILWQTGNINPAQEHLVSNIIRQKLVLGIEKVVPATRIEKTVLLFLPEDEHHELGLLFLYYLLKSRGARTIYIGANISLADVEEVVRLKKPDLAFVHLTGTGPGFHFEKFLTNINQRFLNMKTVVSGLVTVDYKKKLPPLIELKRSLSEMMSFVLSL
jgi:DNA-binding transcriptional MerR regulator